jgi:NAD(P)H-flavin reductase
LKNPYLPYPVRIKDIITETEDRNLKTFHFDFIHPEDEEKFAYVPGQFAELSVAGQGEIPIGILFPYGKGNFDVYGEPGRCGNRISS